MRVTPHRTAAISRVAALDEPTRRLLYDYVCRAGRPVGRDEASAGLGISRPTAAFHLDRLAQDGLLDVVRQRLTGRTGPGAGRPAKLYLRPDREVAVSLPARDYELAAHVLASAVEEAESRGERVAGVLADVARRAGRRLAQTANTDTDTDSAHQDELGDPVPLLERCGFEPHAEEAGISLRNCPFHVLAQRHTDLVCAMAHHLIEGLLDGLGETPWQAQLQPEPGRCCVVLVPREQSGGATGQG